MVSAGRVIQRTGAGVLSVVLLACSVAAQETGGLEPRISPFSKKEVPRFEYLRSDEVNGREGPGERFPVRWVYTRTGTPVEVIAETEGWYKVRDPAGDEVWISAGLLNQVRRVMIKGPDGEPVPMHRSARPSSRVTALIEDQTLLEIVRCQDFWCRVRTGRISGWVDAEYLWGIYPEDTL